MDLHADFKDLLAEFARFEVKYAFDRGYAVGLGDLIANKRAAGRPQDAADVALLERVRRRQNSAK